MTAQNNTQNKPTYEGTIQNLNLDPVRFGYQLHAFFQSSDVSDDAAEIVEGLVNYGADITMNALFVDTDLMREGFPNLVEMVRTQHGDITTLEYLRTIQTALFHYSFSDADFKKAVEKHVDEIKTAYNRTMPEQQEETKEVGKPEILTKSEANFNKHVAPLLELPLSHLLTAVCNHSETWSNLADIVWNECNDQGDHSAYTIESFEQMLSNAPAPEETILDLSNHSVEDIELFNLAKSISTVLKREDTPVKLYNVMSDALGCLQQPEDFIDSPEYVYELLKINKEDK